MRAKLDLSKPRSGERLRPNASALVGLNANKSRRDDRKCSRETRRHRFIRADENCDHKSAFSVINVEAHKEISIRARLLSRADKRRKHEHAPVRRNYQNLEAFVAVAPDGRVSQYWS